MTLPLDGIVVLERAGRLATAATGNLLASFGATVVRVERPDTNVREVDPSQRDLLIAGGKFRIVLDPAQATYASDLKRLIDRADVVLFDTSVMDGSDLRKLETRERVVCCISPDGLDTPDPLPADAGEAMLQARTGVLAATGERNGPPAWVNAPVSEMYAAICAATGVQAALRVREAGGPGQFLDISIVESATDVLRTTLPVILAGKSRGLRMGCAHPLSSPWNCYRAKDGWLLVCSTTNAHWQTLLQLVGRTDLKDDPRFATTALRNANMAVVDGTLQDWIGRHSSAEAVEKIEAVGIPVGPIMTIPQVMEDPVLRERGMVRLAQRQSGAVPVAGSPLTLSRTPGRSPDIVGPALKDVGSLLAGLGQRTSPAVSVSSPAMPLAGIRVVEISRYAAGPLGGAILGSLGAEVIKIEAPEGEDCRYWPPHYEGVGGYFAIYNAGKRSITLDLRQEADREALFRILETADIFSENLRPGATDKMGIGPQELMRRFPRLIVSSVNGYGRGAQQKPALDTVIQAVSGLIAAVKTDSTPARVGFSISDSTAGQFSACMYMAALRERDRSGRGQFLDFSMREASVWLTQAIWPDGGIETCSVREASDGWIVAEASEAAVTAALGEAAGLDRADMAAQLTAAGVRATPIMELDEVLAQPAFVARNSLWRTGGRAEGTPFFAMPYGLTLTPPIRHDRLAPLGEDNEALIGRRSDAAE